MTSLKRSASRQSSRYGSRSGSRASSRPGSRPLSRQTSVLSVTSDGTGLMSEVTQFCSTDACTVDLILLMLYRINLTLREHFKVVWPVGCNLFWFWEFGDWPNKSKDVMCSFIRCLISDVVCGSNAYFIFKSLPGSRADGRALARRKAVDCWAPRRRWWRWTVTMATTTPPSVRSISRPSASNSWAAVRPVSSKSCNHVRIKQIDLLLTEILQCTCTCTCTCRLVIFCLQIYNQIWHPIPSL